MQPLRIVVAHQDFVAATTLAKSLRSHFRSVGMVGSIDDMRSTMAEQAIDVAVLDLELLAPAELEELCHDFPQVGFVCIHRLADEELWARVLAVGAVDCCSTNDVAGITYAARHYAEISHISAA
ncbi:MAG TPA: hypothetical protein VEG30_14355 [Terriglobales bacterium]|nr:hypothetical protein [Terriglobales bacterium]